MGSISPAKILLVLLVALIVLGPEKLPDMARKAGKLFNDFRKVRTGLENEVREVFGDIPGVNGASITSPMSWLTSVTKLPDTSSSASAGGQAESGAPTAEAPGPATPPGWGSPPVQPAFGPPPGSPAKAAGVVSNRRSGATPSSPTIEAWDDPSLN